MIESKILSECENRKIQLNVLGIIGKKNSGKTVITQYLKHMYNYNVYNYADKVKEVCKALFNFTDKQCEDQLLKETIDKFWNVSPRVTFQQIGTQFGQFILPTLFPQINECDQQMTGCRIWVVSLLQSIYHFLIHNANDGDVINIVFGDIRFEHELDSLTKLKSRFIYVHKPTRLSYIDEPEQDIHESEKCGLDMIKKSHIHVFDITNDKKEGLEALYAKLDQLIRLLTHLK